MKTVQLSAIIITKNAAAVLGQCLESVAFADEIIVLDSGSTDDTLYIARQYTEHVHIADDWQGFGIQKNRVLAMATGEWILSIDADEWVTPELQAEIKTCIAKEKETAAFAIPRLSSFCGRFMRHSGWYPDYVTRLFRRGSARFSNDLVHERLEVAGTVKKLQNHLLHRPFDNLEEVFHKMNRYSSDGAQMMFNRGKRASLVTAIAHGFWSFLHTYLIKRGFLDGRQGFILAVTNAEGTYYRYLKLALMREAIKK
ncbi:MAG: glycosyltransferase family 2 protein [Deltaproteobacteria bacterium]|nr:glycosyltransferase family 2 protein [Deltaproteobacteria bacterium]